MEAVSEKADAFGINRRHCKDIYKLRVAVAKVEGGRLVTRRHPPR